MAEHQILIPVSYTHLDVYKRQGVYDVAFEGLIKNMERRYRETYSDNTKQQYEEFMRIRPCSACHGPVSYTHLYE